MPGILQKRCKTDSGGFKLKTVMDCEVQVSVSPSTCLPTFEKQQGQLVNNTVKVKSALFKLSFLIVMVYLLFHIHMHL